MRVGNLAPLLAVLALAACGPGATKIVGDTPKASVAAVDAPPRAPFEGCTWEHFVGEGIRVWSQVCMAGQRETRLATDPASPGVWLTTTHPDLPPERRLAFQVFKNEPDAPFEAMIAIAMAAGAAPADANCVLEPREGAPPANGNDRRILAPSGATKEEWLAALAADPPVATPLPCGTYGVALVGDRYFETDPARPGQVVFVDLGSERQIYEPDTLELTATGH